MSLFSKIFKRNKENDILKDEIVDHSKKNKIVEEKTTEPKPFKPFNVPTTYENVEQPLMDGLTETELRRAIQEKGKEIIKTLRLNDPTADMYLNKGINKNSIFYIEPELNKVFKIFKYIVTNSIYDEAVIAEKRKFADKSKFELFVKDTYRCLCKGRGVCSSDACGMIYLLQKIGIDSTHLVISPPDNDKNNYHSVVAFEISTEKGKKLLIADPTLKRTALNKGIITRLSTIDFCYSLQDYLTKVRPNWHIVAATEKYEIDLPFSTLEK